MDGCASGKIESLKWDTGSAFAGSYARSYSSAGHEWVSPENTGSLRKEKNLLDEEKSSESKRFALCVYRYARIAAVESENGLDGQKRRYLGRDEHAWRPQ